MTLTLRFSATGEEVIVLKALVECYDRIVTGIERERAVAADDLAQLLILADMTDYAVEAREKLARRWRRASKHLQTDFPEEAEAAAGVLGASPPASGNAASMAHGCAVFGSAVGPALTESSRAAGTAPDGPLLLCPEGQTLPAAAAAGNTPAA